MQEGKSLQRTDPHPPVRTLKIEADGDAWKGVLKPKIRLMGRWLERAGFRPGSRVRVTCVALLCCAPVHAHGLFGPDSTSSVLSSRFPSQGNGGLGFGADARRH